MVQIDFAREQKGFPARVPYRRRTRDEVLALSYGMHVPCLLNDGRLGEVKINGAVRTWKRAPERVEVPVRFGLHEFTTYSLAEAQERLVVRVGDVLLHDLVRVTHASGDAVRGVVVGMPSETFIDVVVIESRNGPVAPGSWFMRVPRDGASVFDLPDRLRIEVVKHAPACFVVDQNALVAYEEFKRTFLLH